MASKSMAPQRKSENPQQGSYPASPFRLFEDFFNDWALRTAQRTGDVWRPAVDVVEKEGNLLLRAEVPGMEQSDIDIRLDGNVLTIRGERKPEPESEGYNYHQVESYYGTFSRSFTLPDTVDPEKISAGYKNGVLTITISQKPEVKPRSIKINI
jgi:HSP20 family protein